MWGRLSGPGSRHLPEWRSRAARTRRRIRIPTANEGVGRHHGQHREKTSGTNNGKLLIGRDAAPGTVPLQHGMNAGAANENCEIGLVRSAVRC